MFFTSYPVPLMMVLKKPELPVFHVRRLKSMAEYEARESPLESKQMHVTFPVWPSRILHLAEVLTS
jgi:hypothetical protein